MATVSKSPAVEQILASFDKLPAADQLRVAKEIQNRVALSSDDFDAVDVSQMEDEESIVMARKLFQMYDEEEARRDGPA